MAVTWRDIVAVANLPKDYDYHQIVSWDGLQDSVLVWATANMLPATGGNALEMPSCNPGTNNKIDDTDRRAFAMYGYTRHELVKEESNTFTLAMERLAARIDITNEAYVKGMTADDPKGGFRLSSVRLLHTRPASYITPQTDYISPDVVTVSDWQVTDIPYGKEATPDPDTNPTSEPDKVEVADAEASATLQYLWRTLYTYENSDTEHAPTALEIKGAFRGMEVTRRIDFINKDKQPVPIIRNHRYLVRILPAPGLTDITFDIKVSEWDAVDTVNVKPDQTEVPEITAISTDMTPNLTDPTIKVYDTYYTQDGKIAFDAVCNFAPDVRVKYYNTDNDTWQTTSPYEADWFTLTKSDTELVSLTKGGNEAYKRHIEVSLKSFSTNLPRKAMLLINNGGSEVECDTVYIRHVLTYPGTDFEPVAVAQRDDGSDIIWAPVNVGATKIATNITSTYTEDVFAQCGYYFQWGRSTKLKYSEDKSDFIRPTTQPNYEDAYKNEGIYANLMIAGDPAYSCWFKEATKDNLPPSLTNFLWPREVDPCPTGWHLPTEDEAKKLAALIDISKISNNVLMVNNLTLPLAGRRIYDSSVLSYASSAYCWTSSLDWDVRGHALSVSHVSLDADEQVVSSNACNVRCVLDQLP
ncbi:fibrobacter succinogenes major paralogous domain-containing protein [Parabacteroides faecis]|uniref:fibrobacter succinogenes major paralogous domain-containing protein n=1 Tax=Parabacteroides faecis TaxID=1217282 RepID=UPI0021659F8A|nr:fibrobacter succinogenes major paralogous domain-containing protein [Parabacteroides faecis]MCS2892292.1 fibrobacter succinogenes major paralogous domain-containing protein [Parabacteroides faecis]